MENKAKIEELKALINDVNFDKNELLEKISQHFFAESGKKVLKRISSIKSYLNSSIKDKIEMPKFEYYELLTGLHEKPLDEINEFINNMEKENLSDIINAEYLLSKMDCYNKLGESLTNLDKLPSTEVGGAKVIKLSGEDFRVFIHVTNTKSDPENFTENCIKRQITSGWSSGLLSQSLIGQEHIGAFKNGLTSHVTFIYDHNPNNELNAIKSEDAWVEDEENLDHNIPDEFISPEDLLKNTKKYNEVAVTLKEKTKPSALCVIDEPNEVIIALSKKYNLPIVSIDGEAYNYQPYETSKTQTPE